MKEMIIKFWKKWFGQKATGQVANLIHDRTEAVTPKAEKASAPSPMLERLEAYLFDHYDFRFNVLTDTTGSRRFLCVEVKGKIDCSNIDHTQLYAQLKAELLGGERYWFTSEEEKEIQENNRAFYKQSPAQEIFYKCFRLPANEKEGRLMTATEIFCRLQKKFPAALRGSNASQMGKTLQALGVRHTHTRQGNAYLVVPV